MKVILWHPEGKCHNDCVMLPISDTLHSAFSFVAINSKNKRFFSQIEFHTVGPPHFGGLEGKYLSGFSSTIYIPLDLLVCLFMNL